MYKNFFRLNCVSIIIGSFICSCGEKPKPALGTEAVDANHALATYKVPPGFKIEMVASEPIISDPVDMEIDEYGNLYVVEMHGYPTDVNNKGTVALLKDTDGDGRMDKRTVFAKGLIMPNGVMRWKKGIIVTDPPNVLYMEDLNGDGVSDKVDTVLTGFSKSNPQINVNNPVYGLDNWIYLAHRGAISTRKYKEFADEGGDIYFPQKPDATRLPNNADGHTVRFRPENYKLEKTSSRAHFGQTFDAWGHHILAHNENHCYEELIADRYLQRNPDLIIQNADQSLSDHGDVAEVFPITKIQNQEKTAIVTEEPGVMTSCSGITSYLGGLFPAPYDKNVSFVCESVSNIVHADVLNDDGASFKASRILQHEEFLASTDAWARPVNMYIGPDGALYVLDYYRRVIEHPEWLSDEVVSEGGLFDGNDKGRIYRITPTGAPAAEWMKGLNLGHATNVQLVENLSNKNVWWRINSQRLLVDRADKQIVPALVQMARNKTSPLGRLHSLWALEGIGSLSNDIIIEALKDSVGGIRENALKLAELHLDDAGVINALLNMAKDPDAKVRYQLLLTLGFINTPASAAVRNEILFKDINDKWAQVAALSASSSQTAALLQVVIDKYKHDVPAYASMVQQLTTMIGISGSPVTIHRLIHQATALDPKKTRVWQSSVLEGLASGLETRKSKSADSLNAFKNEQTVLVNTFFDNPISDIRKASIRVLKAIGLSDETLAKTAITKCLAIAGNKSNPADKRSEALSFLILRDVTPYETELKNYINPNEDLSIQSAALKSLVTINDNAICNYFLEKWPTLTPGLRDIALGAFFVNKTRVALLLDAIASKKIEQASLGWSRSSRLMGYPDSLLRNKAVALLNKDEGRLVNKDYQQALQLQGDEVKGKTVFLTNCGTCHQIRGKLGNAFGPDLGTVHNWLPKNILANVLSPDLSIAGGFDLWSVELKNGETLQGLISNETSAAITLKTGPGVENAINRQDIISLKTVGISAMPKGLANKINQQQMADLLAYLKQNK